MFSWLFNWCKRKPPKKKVVVVYSLETGGQFTFPIYIIMDCQDADYMRNIITGTRLGIDAAGGILSREFLNSHDFVIAQSLESALNPDWRSRGFSVYPPARQMTLAEFEQMLKELRK
ncbi:hypothetical protein HY501_00555 [Candidatus Woesearchaeota archaeon]|nr:hypothetical protein [Candidatus Woesearchaeota archaeon]